MDCFIFVQPTGLPLTPEFGKWIQEELTRATNAWRAQFRGYVQVKRDTDVTAGDIGTNNLVVWGDPQSNRLLAKMAKQLPVKWSEGQVSLGANHYSAKDFAPVLIYPNPLNPGKYVVLNSGFTFSQFAKASNAQQTPKLPD